MKSKKRNHLIIVLVVLLLALAVGYATFSTNLTISGSATAKGDWSVHFDTSDGGRTDNDKIITSISDTAVEVTANLTQPGDSKTATVNILNDGSVAAKLTAFTVKVKDVNDAELKTVTIPAEGGTYASGAIKMTITQLTVNTSTIAAKSGDTPGSQAYSLTFEWPSDLTSTEVDATINFEISFTYAQA